MRLKGQFTFGSNYTFLVDVKYRRPRSSPPCTNPRAANNRSGILRRTRLPCAKSPRTSSARRSAFTSSRSPRCAKTVPTARVRSSNSSSTTPIITTSTSRPKTSCSSSLLCSSTCSSTTPTARAVTFSLQRTPINSSASTTASASTRTTSSAPCCGISAGNPFPDDLLPLLDLKSTLLTDLQPYLSPTEILALQSRADLLAQAPSSSPASRATAASSPGHRYKVSGVKFQVSRDT
ncbi:MAG: hypothetical protein MZV64_00435 [Ignavibacteriales bacterium]|nr:hypothetical protein [Ignavibacteriales bacterium]